MHFYLCWFYIGDPKNMIHTLFNLKLVELLRQYKIVLSFYVIETILNDFHWFYVKTTWIQRHVVDSLSPNVVLSDVFGTKASIYKAGGRLTTRYREVSKPRDSGLDLSNRSEIWQAPGRHGCRDASQISERDDHYNIQSRGFETSRDLAVRL